MAHPTDRDGGPPTGGSSEIESRPSSLVDRTTKDARRSWLPVLLLVIVVSPGCRGAPEPPPERGYELVDSGIRVRQERMVGFVPVPGRPDEALVLAQDGPIHRVWLDGDRAAEPFADLSTREDPDDEVFVGREEGLLSLAFDPRFPEPPHVYVYSNKPPPQGPREPCLDEVEGEAPVDRTYHSRNTLSRFVVDTASMTLSEESEEVVLEYPDERELHNGGGLVFDEDGHLYLGLGDGAWGLGPEFNDPCRNAQNLDTLRGTVLRIDVLDEETYTIPQGNPLVGREGRDELWAWGFRNPWQMSLDPGTGALWASEVGDAHWEEINRVERGKNYGWPIYEGPLCWDEARPDEDRCDVLEDYAPPYATYCLQEVEDCPYLEEDEYHLDCATVGGHAYRGSAHPELDGWLVFADYCSGRVRAVDTEDPAREPVVLVEAPATTEEGDELPPTPIASVGTGPDGEPVFVTYADDGLLRLARRER